MDPERLADLIERARRREPAAFEALIEAYSHRLYGFLYRLTGNRHDTDDLLQEVFVRVVRMIGKYKHDGRFESWLFRIAMNLARDRVRRLSRSPIVSTGTSGSAGANDGPGDALSHAADDRMRPDEAAELADHVDCLQRALGRLGQAEREVIMLRHFSEMSYNEIAEVMDTPLGTALARGHRGLKRLRQLMEEASHRDE